MAVWLPDGRLAVDNSTLSSLATCGTQAMMAYGLSLRAPEGTNLPAEAGTAIHKAVEAYFKTGKRFEAIAKLKEVYEPIAERHAQPDDRLGYDNIARCLESWLDKYPPGQLPYDVVPGAIEVPFQLPLTKEVAYVGQIDAIVTPRGSDRLWLLDTKSTGRVDQKFKAQFSIGSQMSGYYWAAQQLFNQEVEGIYINVVHAGKVPGSDRKCGTHGRKYSECGSWHMDHGVHKYYRSEGEIEAWLADVKVLQTSRRWGMLTSAESGFIRLALCAITTNSASNCGIPDMRQRTSSSIRGCLAPWTKRRTNESHTADLSSDLCGLR
jgi:hypothetical protein